MRILNKYISDGTVLDMIWKWLKAGYMEEGKFHEVESGTPQGGVISPLLANIYLNDLPKRAPSKQDSALQTKRSGVLHPRPFTEDTSVTELRNYLENSRKHVGKPYALVGHVRFDEGVAMRMVTLLYRGLFGEGLKIRRLAHKEFRSFCRILWA